MAHLTCGHIGKTPVTLYRAERSAPSPALAEIYPRNHDSPGTTSNIPTCQTKVYLHACPDVVYGLGHHKQLRDHIILKSDQDFN